MATRSLAATECQICREKVQARSLLSCPSCEYNQCHECLKAYFTGTVAPKCANCGVIFTREFVSTKWASFLRSYEKMRGSVLLSSQLALLPETQQYVPAFLAAAGAEADAEYTALKTKKCQLEAALTSTKTHLWQLGAIREAVAKKDYNLAKRRHDEYTATRDNRKRTAAERTDGVPEQPGTEANNKRQREWFLGLAMQIKCPVNECRGFAIPTSQLEATANCGICSVQVCLSCFVAAIPGVAGPHCCKEEDLATANEVAASTRPCPKCSARISKISGCDQMWCVCCKTAFSWNTGKIESGAVHNPHYYEALRTGIIAPGEDNAAQLNGCRDPTAIEIIRLLRVKGQSVSPAAKRLESFHRFIIHTEAYFRDPGELDNTHLRVRFLAKDIDSTDELARLLQAAEKRHLHKRELYDITTAIIQAGHDMFRRLVASGPATANIVARFSAELDRIIAFANEQFEKIATVYKSSKMWAVKECLSSAQFYQEQVSVKAGGVAG